MKFARRSKTESPYCSPVSPGSARRACFAPSASDCRKLASDSRTATTPRSVAATSTASSASRSVCRPRLPPPRSSGAVSTHVEELGRERCHPVFLLDEAHLLHPDVPDHLHILLN